MSSGSKDVWYLLYISILIKGSRSKDFSPHRGLKQKDSLSLFLFTIMTVGLIGMMREAIRDNLFKGDLMGMKGIEIDLLLYMLMRECSLEMLHIVVIPLTK